MAQCGNQAILTQTVIQLLEVPGIILNVFSIYTNKITFTIGSKFSLMFFSKIKLEIFAAISYRIAHCEVASPIWRQMWKEITEKPRLASAMVRQGVREEGMGAASAEEDKAAQTEELSLPRHCKT